MHSFSPSQDQRRAFAAAVFDLDGTLIDSVADIGVALNHLLTEYGRPLLDRTQVRNLIGDGSRELVRQAFIVAGGALDEAALVVALDRYLDIYAAQPIPTDCLYPGVREVLQTLADDGLRLGLCTNKPDRVTNHILEALDIAYLFEAVCGGDTLPQRKPDPAPVRWVLDQLGVLPSQAVMVGDSRNDVLAARAVGMPVVVVSYGYSRMPPASLDADRLIHRFTELPEALVDVMMRMGR